MANKTELIKHLKMKDYFDGESWPEINRQFFDNLAIKYDAGNKLHSFGTKEKMDYEAIKKLGIKPGQKILDCATGSGDIALKIAEMYPSVEVIAIDASENMLKIAREKQKSKNLANISFINGDILNLPFEAQTFDTVVISYGLRNLVDLSAGLSEMFRIMKDGGKFSNIDQGKPENPLFKMIYNIYFYNIAPIIGKLVFHRGEFNSFRYLPESNKFFPSPRELKRLMGDQGLEDISLHSYWQGAVSQQVGTLKKDS